MPKNPRMTKNLTPRPTIYNGIQMRSRLEAAWAEQFDAFDWPWRYEPMAYADSSGQYLPDFEVDVPGASQPVFFEVKPGYWLTPEHWGFKGNTLDTDNWNDAFLAQSAEIHRMANIVRRNRPGAMFILATGVCDTDGKIWMSAAANDPLYPTDDTVHVVPVKCTICPTTLGLGPMFNCPRHSWASQRVPSPVASLYSVSGFGFYDDHMATDPFGALLGEGPPG